MALAAMNLTELPKHGNRMFECPFISPRIELQHADPLHGVAAFVSAAWFRGAHEGAHELLVSGAGHRFDIDVVSG